MPSWCTFSCGVSILVDQQSLTLAFVRTFGQFAAGMVDGIFVEIMHDTGWRFMLGLAAIPSIVMYIGFQSLPESPRWLAIHGYIEQALEVLKSLRETEQDAADELAEIMESIKEQNERSQNNHRHHNNSNNNAGHEGDDDLNDDADDSAATEYGSAPRLQYYQYRKQSFLERLGNMVADPAARKALVLGCGLMVIQQFSGVNTYVLFCIQSMAPNVVTLRHQSNVLCSQYLRNVRIRRSQVYLAIRIHRSGSSCRRGY